MVESSKNEKTVSGKVNVFHSCKGGTGVTFLATNVACALAFNSRKKIILVDLDLQYGDANILLNVKPEKTIGDLIPVLDEVTIEDIRLILTIHQSGLHFLSAPAKIEQAELFTPYQLKRLLLVLAQNFDYVIVNTAAGVDEKNLAILESAAAIELMMTSEIAAVVATKKLVNLLQTISFSPQIFKVIINRANAFYGLSGEEIAKTMAPLEVIAEIGYDYPFVGDSINTGKPMVLQPASETTNQINNIAAGIQPYKFIPVKSSFLAKLSR